MYRESLVIILILFQIVLFAGEVTSQEMFGTVGGAICSGNREARRLIKTYRHLKLNKQVKASPTTKQIDS